MRDQPAPVIAAHGLFIDYRLKDRWLNAIHNVSLTIEPGEIHGLVGESGSGKSTLALALMRYMAGNARIAAGDILFDGENLVNKSDADMRRLWGDRMALVPQNPLAALNPSYTIGEQIAEVLRQHAGLPPRAARQRVEEMLDRVRIPDPRAIARRYPHQLSGGMQQRVTIAMALCTSPRLLVLDEPTTALDVTTQAVILDLFRDLIRENAGAALYVSHNLGTVAQLCDRITVLYGGEVMASGPVHAIYASSIHPYTMGLLASIPRRQQAQLQETRLPTIEGIAPSLAERSAGCVFAPRCPLASEAHGCFTVKPRAEAVDAARVVACHRWREISSDTVKLKTEPEQKLDSAPPRAGYVLEAQNIRKRFGSHTLLSRLTGDGSNFVQAVDDVSLRIRQRSTLGLVGESGSGKSTLARVIVALAAADSGEIALCEAQIPNTLAARSKDVLRNLQMVFQNPNDALNPYTPIGQALVRTIMQLSSPRPTRQQARERALELLDAVRLTPDYLERYPNELSGGEKQRIAIARAFAANPALVVADEPTSSLDVSVQAVILNLLKDLRAQEGASYLLISHDLDVITYLADWIAVLYLGQIVEVGDTHDVYNVPSHPYTEALLSAIPEPDPTRQPGHIRLTGDVPSASRIPPGCRFHTRCPRFLGDICKTQEPPWRDAGDGHFIRCHIPVEELSVLQQTNGSSQPQEQQRS